MSEGGSGVLRGGSGKETQKCLSASGWTKEPLRSELSACK